MRVYRTTLTHGTYVQALEHAEAYADEMDIPFRRVSQLKEMFMVTIGGGNGEGDIMAYFRHLPMPFMFAEQDTAFLDFIYVLPEYRKQGVFEYVLRYLNANHNVMWRVVQENESFYEHCFTKYIDYRVHISKDAAFYLIPQGDLHNAEKTG